MGHIDLWVWWVSAAIILALVEVISLDLVLLMFAGGAASAGLAQALGAPWWAQIAVFIAVSAVLLLTLRPWLLVHLRGRVQLQDTNVHAYAGKPATAVTPVDASGGRVKLLGEVWTARTDDSQTIPPGAQVIVTKIDGATAVVSSQITT
ncbi:NfeD family protein [Rarobacter faecitabidus]|uniref:Membrane protein implicated in regulation of membrane protease activity n=1 Tax=Rarobacter faecitabidus TaxID=13243 RepID=A0A542ZVH1_RARFA|nr:NfeD family protein [Rarobacter faecitabidus]TQL64358.1 membrane protein implicated in regulation of membrane protease activity [Rarobacter faecitabidus]